MRSELFEVPELRGSDSPLYDALDAGFVRIRTVRPRGGRATLSLTASVPLSTPQLTRVRAILGADPNLTLDGRFAGTAVGSTASLPIERT